MDLNHGKLELIYIPRKPLSCPTQTPNAQWSAWTHCLPGGLCKKPSDWVIFRVFFPPQKLTLDNAKKQEGKKKTKPKASGIPQGLVPILSGAGEARQAQPRQPGTSSPRRPQRAAAPYLPHGEIPIIHPAGKGLITPCCCRQGRNPSSFPPQASFHPHLLLPVWSLGFFEFEVFPSPPFFFLSFAGGDSS